MNFLRKVQNLPVEQKRVIVWGITILVGIALLAWWFGDIRKQLSETSQGPGIEEQFQIQELQNQLQSIPVTIPNGEQ